MHGRRKLLAVSSNAIAVPSDATTGTTTLAISATEPLDTNTPADKLLHPTVAKAVVGSGSDVATCEHITIPDSDKGQQFTQ